jgi:ATP-dependent DNA helicase RecG
MWGCRVSGISLPKEAEPVGPWFCSKRMEPLEYPEPALREAILNSIIHKDYSSTYIFLRVYEDKLTLFNPGAFPEGYDIERIKNEHPSKPGNRNIAEFF